MVTKHDTAPQEPQAEEDTPKAPSERPRKPVARDRRHTLCATFPLIIQNGRQRVLSVRHTRSSTESNPVRSAVACQVCGLDAEATRGTAGGKMAGEGGLNVRADRQFNKFVWNYIRGEEQDGRLTGLTGGAHPGTQHGTVCRFLMVRVLEVMGKGLRGGESTDHEETGDQQTGENPCHTLRHDVAPGRSDRNRAERPESRRAAPASR